MATTEWARERPETSDLSIGYFGASTDAAAVLRGAPRNDREIYEVLSCETDLRIVEGAGHLFEVERELEAVADHAADWFAKYLE